MASDRFGMFLLLGGAVAALAGVLSHFDYNAAAVPTALVSGFITGKANDWARWGPLWPPAGDGKKDVEGERG